MINLARKKTIFNVRYKVHGKLHFKKIFNCTFKKYFDLVIKRNDETHKNGHLITFNYPEPILKKGKFFLKVCWKDGISPYKALTFFHDSVIKK